MSARNLELHESRKGHPMKALSIRQPWAWLIASGFKDIENRNWPTSFRGPVLIHAGKKMDAETLRDIIGGEHPVTGERLPRDVFDSLERVSPLPVGGIVGECEIVDCVVRSSSPWFVGRYGFVIRNARPVPFHPCRGALGFFDPPLAIAA